MEERQKRAVIRFFNAYWLKEYVMLLKHCEVYFSKSGKQPMLISVIDKRRKTKGLTDRFKGIVSVYALSKAMGVPFRLILDRKSTRLNSSHVKISYAVFCLKKKK